jgi:hypothetical protein
VANSVWINPGGFINNGTNIIFPLNLPFDYQATGLGTTSTDGGILENITAATGAATVQISPRLRLRGTAWDTAASETVDFFMENLPATAATPTGTLKFGYSLNGAAASYPFTVSSAGAGTLLSNLTVASNWSASGSVQNMSADYPIAWQSTNLLAGNATNQELRTGSGARFGFSSNSNPAVAVLDAYFTRAAAGSLAVSDGVNGKAFGLINELTELTTIAAAATTDTTIQMPAASVVLAVSVRVTTVIPTAATFTVGDSGSAARFSTAAVSTAATSTDPGTKAGAYYNASALSIRITPNLTPADNSGRLRVTIYYYSVTPPTS